MNGSSSATLSLSYSSGVALTIGSGSFAGAIVDYGVASSLLKTTTGTLLLSGSNGMHGETTVQAGTLLFGRHELHPQHEPLPGHGQRGGGRRPLAPDLQDNLLASRQPGSAIAEASNGTILITSFNVSDTIDLSNSSTARTFPTSASARWGPRPTAAASRPTARFTGWAAPAARCSTSPP